MKQTGANIMICDANIHQSWLWQLGEGEEDCVMYVSVHIKYQVLLSIHLCYTNGLLG